ncbi:cbb3-type cytochrome c oxidase N-terminal domain-containing protein [Mucilaginibacter paludis]|uniref:Cytochrome c class I n=1 Tax=Mucilaginibacter paludis DSM 18603 TaxID=714943 RepID=H1YJ06_9SPHI|nr:cbb3-type cytochrome c oxidase N-terminal domain-containing protein [Mucilaginibacter paludis]EHQ27701.1 cytochrome c class I [Mucilaginibacter paludis DSM 18603]
MKFYRIAILLPLLLFAQPALAANDSLLPGDVMNAIGYVAIILALILFLAVMLMLLRTFKVLTRIILKMDGYTEEQIAAEMAPAKKEKKPTGEVWNKLLSLRPLSEEKEILIEHDYDGIQELDNPTPTWFMVLFYGTITFAVGYLLVYHVLGIGQLQYDEYKTEVAQADIAKKEYLSKAANRVDENTVKLVSDPAVLASGQAIFKQTCSPCHGEHGQGVVGPNLTDDYWLHGSKISDLFKTIKYGVAAKGMPTWEKQLSPKQISDVANYIKSIHDTHPAGAKEPQGVKEVDEAASTKLASK